MLRQSLVLTTQIDYAATLKPGATGMRARAAARARRASVARATVAEKGMKQLNEVI